MDSGEFKHPLKDFLKIISERKLYIDSNWTFMLHRKTKIIVWIFILQFSFLYMADFDSMKCLDGDNILKDDKSFAAYCWTQGTFIVQENLNGTIDKHVAHPGVGRTEKNSTLLYQLNYPWMYGYMGFLFIVFSVPWSLWKNFFEGQRLECLMKQLNFVIVEDEKELDTKKKRVVNYFIVNLHCHNFFAVKYIVCEILNLFNVIFQIWFTDFLLNGGFRTYGIDVLQFQMNYDVSNIDPFNRLFPKVTTCHVSLVGPSGSLTIRAGLCVLPFNNFLDKTYLLLWFWFMILTVMSFMGLIYRVITILVPSVRFWLLRIRTIRCDPDNIRVICQNCRYGDWLLIFTLRNCVDGWVIDDVLDQFAEKLKKPED